MTYKLDDFDSEVEMLEKINEQQSIIHKDEISIKTMMSNMEKLEEENKQLRTQLLLCQQSKDGRFQVGEVPPITVGRTISFSTNGDD